MEREGGWAVSLQETNVPNSALFYYMTDYETTKAAVEALTTDTV